MNARIPALLSASLLLVAAAGCVQPTPPPPAAPPAPVVRKEDPVKRGEYLVKILVCNDCHTPFKMGPNGPEPDMSRMLSGHPADLKLPAPPKLPAGWGMVGDDTNTAYAGPWGISYSMNLTPDPTGMGAWTEDIFIKALRTGTHWGTSRPILPPMPWPSYGQMTDDDLKAVFAYLKTIPPVANQVPDAVLAPPPPAAGKK